MLADIQEDRPNIVNPTATLCLLLIHYRYFLAGCDRCPLVQLEGILVWLLSVGVNMEARGAGSWCGGMDG
jgi:hypothetical protein